MINILIGIAGALNLFLAYLTYNKNSRSLSNISFALLAFIMGVWAFLFIPYNSPFLYPSVFWIKAVYFVVIFMIAAMVNFAYSFPYGDKPNKWVLITYFLLNIPAAYWLLFTDKFVKAVEMTPTGPEAILGSNYIYVVIVWIFFTSGFFQYKMIRKYLKAIGKFKFQLLYMFLGLGIYIAGAVVLDAILPVFFHTSAYFSLSAVFSLFFVGSTAYAIGKHRLLDIRVALHELVIFLINSSLISIVILVGAVGYWVFSGQGIKYEVIPVILGISVTLVILYERLAFVSAAIARYLRLSVYDYQNALSELSLRLSANLELQKLIETLCETLADIFRLKKIAILLYDQEKKEYVLQKSLGFDQTKDNIELLFNSFTTVYLTRGPKVLDLEELRKIASEGVTVGFEENSLKQLAEIMGKEKLSLIIPLLSSNKIIGLVVLGDKASLDPYTVQDINFLTTMAYEASVAFQNAKSYQEIQRFNITLREEVDEATKELKQANSQLEELDKLKNDFVSVASHELRTPMTAIRSYAWMALHKADVPLSDKMQKYLVRVLISTERLINLVNDMLNVSRIESGKIEIMPEIVDLLSLTKDIIDEVYYSKSQEKTIQFVILEKKVPKVFADPEKLRQVFLNLVGNSLKFTPDGGKILIDFFTDGKTVEVSVKDTGVGISKDDLGRLFQKFGRLDNSYVASASSGGTGLGLYISKNLVQLMHGKLWAASEGLGKGSTFSFSLPIASKEIVSRAKDFTVRSMGEPKPLEPVAI